MKPFRFTLEALLTLRKQQEQKALEQYAQSLVVKRQAAENLQNAQFELALSWQEWREKSAKGFAAYEAAQVHACQKALNERIDDCGRALQNAERRVNGAMQNMLRARQQREIVDRCFDKQKARYARELAREEQKFIDDLAGRGNNSLFALQSVETPL